MPRSSSTSSSRPILGRAMAILALPLSKAKARKCLLLFNKHRPGANRRLRHYNYAYAGEYQFSSSASPLLLPRPPGVSTWRSIRKRKTSSGSTARMILASLCFCGASAAGEGAGLDGLLPPPPPPRAHEYPRALGWAGDDDEELEEEECGDEEVDGRAERFIERFYEEMRLQQQQQSSLTHRLL